MRKERNKVSPQVMQKRMDRYFAKREEFSKMPLLDVLDEEGNVTQRGLRTIWREKKVLATDKKKMSSTDSTALVHVVDEMMQQQMREIAEKEQAEEATGENGTTEPITGEGAE